MSDNLNVVSQNLNGLAVLERKRRTDPRGSFERLFEDDVFAELGFAPQICQINLSHTRGKGTVRGMHFQHPPACENKIVTCLSGSIFDVAIDLRKDSPSFLQWHSEILSDDNRRSLVIPEGFAHGFQALSDDISILYFHSHAYAPESEGGLSYDDPELGIQWPLSVTEISDRDRNWPRLTNNFEGLVL